MATRRRRYGWTMDEFQTQHREALRQVARIAARRQAALKEVDLLTEELRRAVVYAASLDGAPIRSIRKLSKLNANKVALWWRQAGLDQRRISEDWFKEVDDLAELLTDDGHAGMRGPVGDHTP